jgi:hypothetical protein
MLWHAAASVNSVTLCHPLPYGRRAAPSKEDDRALEKGTDICHAPTRDNTVTSNQWSASPPSLSALYSHPHRCATIPCAATPSLTLWEPGTTRHRHAAAVHLTALRQLHPRVSVRTATKREAPTQPPSKPFLGGYRTRHDVRREQDSPGRLSTPWHCTPFRHT